MKSVIAFLAALVAAFSLAGCASKPPPTMVLRQGNDTLTLMTTPCNSKVTALIWPEFQAQFKNASALVGGQTFDACWVLHDKETVYIHFEDDDNAFIPLSMFIETTEQPKPKKQEDWRRSA